MFEIAGRVIGNNFPVYIIAEMSANHGHSFETAVNVLQAAKEAGADAIKLQTYTPDTISMKGDNEYFQIRSGSRWDGRTLYDLYSEAYMPWEWQPKLKQIADLLSTGIIETYTPKRKMLVKDLLKELNLEGKYFGILVDGKKANEDTVLDENSDIVILPHIAGGF